MKTITISDEEFAKVQSVLKKEETVSESKKKTIIYKTDGSVLYESDKETIKEAVVEANLRGVDLRGVDLRGANLRGAELCEVKFFGKGGTTKIKKNQVSDFFKALGIIVEE